MSYTLRNLKLSAPFGMSLLLPLCYILNIDTMLLVLLVIGSITPPVRSEYSAKTEMRPVLMYFLIVCLSPMVILLPFAENGNTQFLTLCVLSITAVVCFEACVMPITSENKRGRQCLLSMSLSMLSAATGLAIPTIGIDVGTGLQRFSIGITELYGGINFVVIVLGLCCLGEILYSVSNQFAFNSDRTQISNASEARQTTESICRRFCKGAELLLALTLCISFSQASAIIVGTISIYVSQYTDPFSSNIDIPHLGTVYDIALISIVFICVYRVLSKSMLNRFDRKDELTSEMTKSMNPDKDLRNKSMSPVAIYIIFTVMAFVGAYFIHYRLFDMFLLIAFGFAGFLMRRLNFPITPLIVCAALGHHMERAYRETFSLIYLTVLFFLLSFVVVAIYIKIAIKPDSNNRGNTSFNYIGDYKRQ